MDPRAKLIRFMEKKAEYLSEKFGIKPECYFNEEDRKAILSWDEADAEKVWEEIRHEITSLSERGLTSSACPFCVMCKFSEEELDCFSCGYSKTHGACLLEDSDWHQVLGRIGEVVGDRDGYRHYPQNEDYRRWIEEIEEGRDETK